MANINQCERNKRQQIFRIKTKIAGTMVIIAGIILLLINLQVLPEEVRRFVFSWSSILLMIALINIVDKKTRKLGVMLLLLSIIAGLRWCGFMQNYWDITGPVLLIFFGILIISHRHSKKHHEFKVPDDRVFIVNNEYTINDSNFFTGSERRFVDVEFRGGTVNNLLGGSKIDLSQATLAKGENLLEVNCFLGGVSIIVPFDWKVSLKTSAFAGFFEDKRRINSGNLEIMPDRELIIAGNMFLAGGEIKNK